MTEQAQRILVLGVGVSGQAAARLLASEGVDVTAIDEADGPAQEAAARTLREAGVRIQLGVSSLPDLRPEVAVVSPGIPRDAAWLQTLRNQGTPCWSELELGWRRRRAPVIAVTGSNGKSTTVALISRILDRAGLRTEPAGNFGPPVCEVVQKDLDWLTLEVSSFQLEWVDAFRPDIGVLLNLTPNHLDRHGSMSAYQAAKFALFSKTRGADRCLVPEALLDTVRSESGGQGQWVTFGVSRSADYRYHEGRVWKGDRVWVDLTASRWSNPVWGPALAAIAAVADRLEIPAEVVAEAVRSFPGLPHRMEPIGACRNVTFVNDSKATTLASMRAAVRMSDPPIRLIAGGMLKETDLAEGMDALRSRLAAVYLMGRDAGLLGQAWSSLVPTHQCRTLSQAVSRAWGESAPGDTILLSPGAASFDQFSGFAQRGERFRHMVERLQTLPGSEDNSENQTECGRHRERIV